MMPPDEPMPMQGTDSTGQNPTSCPVEYLQWFVNGTLPKEERNAVEAHLAGCATCRADVSTWAELRRGMRDVCAHTPEPRADLFAQIESRIDALPSPAAWSWAKSFLQGCLLAVSICWEHCQMQARLIRRDLFWMPLLIVPLTAFAIYLPRPWQPAPGTAALLAALLTAMGMAFLYGRDADAAREIVLVTPTSPRLVLGIRCCLVFGYDLLINCGLVLPFLALHGTITPAWFLANWLAPLCCLSAIALLMSVLVNAGAAVLACTLLWTLRTLRGIQTFLLGGTQTFPEASWQQSYEQFWHQGPLLFLVAVLAVALAFVALERKGRFVR